jgi:alpha-1,2-mannosyltransferase
VVVGFALAYNPLDLFIYVLGGKAVGHDNLLYSSQLAEHWFTYPPFAAALFAPLGQLPFVVVKLLWELGTVAALGWCCAVVLTLAGRRPRWSVVAAALFLEPVWHTLFLGQINLLLAALVLTDLRRLHLGRGAGIGIGVAAAIKLTPAIFIVLLVVGGRVKAAVTAAGSFLLCSLGAWVVAPRASRLYWARLWHDTTRVHPGYISNQSPYGAVTRIFGTPDTWYVLVPAALGLVGIAVAAAHAHRHEWLTAAATTGTTGLLVSPISWSHHWIWALPVLVVLVRDGHRGWAIAGYGLFALAPIWWTPHHGGPAEYGRHGLLTVAANSYLIAGIAFLGYLAYRVPRVRDRVLSVKRGISLVLTRCIRQEYRGSMTVPLALLGLLEREPSHGYDLKRDYDAYFGRGKPLPYGQVYSTLSRLARDGKVVVGESEPGAGPDRKRYVITERGATEVEAWLAEPVEAEAHLQTVLFTKVVLALMLGRNAEAYLDAQRAAHMQRMRELTELRRNGPLVNALLADHGLFHLEADLRWIDLTAARLDALGAEVRQ